MAANDIVWVKKDDQLAKCERRQLPAMKAAGWSIAPPPLLAEETTEQAPVRASTDGMIRMYRNGAVAYADEATRRAMLRAGWAIGEPPEPDSDLADLLMSLDPSVDEMWNADGGLKMGVFNEAFDRKETKASILDTWPGFSRDVLLRAQAEE